MWQFFLVYCINTQSLESTKMKWASSKMLIKQGQGVIPGLGHECIQQKALQHNKSRERERGRVRRESSASHWPTKELVRISQFIILICASSPLQKVFLWVIFYTVTIWFHQDCFITVIVLLRACCYQAQMLYPSVGCLAFCVCVISKCLLATYMTIAY